MISVEDLYALYRKCTGISTDSRTIKEGSMFFALKGENFDGNNFAEAALKAGARYAVVDRVTLEGLTFKGRKCILVENVLRTMQEMAAFHRRQFDIPVLGITGTNGKTTTKELIAAVLSKSYEVTATKANFNNHIGVPLSLLSINEKTQIAVIEMGASAPGEIARLAQIAQPTCGIVTNVGKAHLLGFGSFEGVIKAKGELYDYLRQKGGVAFYNVDNQYLSEMINNRHGLPVRKYGVHFQEVEVFNPTFEEPFLTIKLAENNNVVVKTKLVGDYNADNVMAALCIAEYFEVPLDKAISAITSYQPSNNRSQLVRTDNNLLIVDAYNANPTSMEAALNNFSSTEFENKTLILGDMLELGEESLAEHSHILSIAVRLCDSIYVVGNEFAKAVGMMNSYSDSIKCFPDSETLGSYLRANPLSERTILIKGSNGTHLQEIVNML